MNIRRHLWIGSALAAVIAVAAGPGNGQQAPAAPAAAPAAAPSQFKYSTPVPPGIASPDRVETRLGTLRFFDGFPDKATVDKLYDNLDFQRAVQAYLLALPPVSQAANRTAILELGPANTTVPIFEQLMDSRSIFLTANDNTAYSWMWIDLRNGPLVLEAPPRVLGAINDMWYRWVADVGFTGPDEGRGGKYLLLPPVTTGTVPDGYFVVRPRDVQHLGSVAQLPGRRRPEARRGTGEEVDARLSARRRRQPAADEVRGRFRQGVQHGGSGELHLLGISEPGGAGGAERVARPGHARYSMRRSASRRASRSRPTRE